MREFHGNTLRCADGPCLSGLTSLNPIHASSNQSCCNLNAFWCCGSCSFLAHSTLGSMTSLCTLVRHSVCLVLLLHASTAWEKPDFCGTYDCPIYTVVEETDVSALSNLSNVIERTDVSALSNLCSKCKCVIELIQRHRTNRRKCVIELMQ